MRFSAFTQAHIEDLVKVAVVDELTTQLEGLALSNSAAEARQNATLFAANAAESHVERSDPTAATKIRRARQLRLDRVDEDLKHKSAELEQRSKSTSAMNGKLLKAMIPGLSAKRVVASKERERSIERLKRKIAGALPVNGGSRRSLRFP